MTRSPNGLIMYNGQTQGDFIELLLEDSFLFFNFNLGGKQNKRLVPILYFKFVNKLKTFL